MTGAAPLALLEHGQLVETELTVVPTINDSAGDPVTVYLARLAPGKSRATMNAALATAAATLGAVDAHHIPWGALRYPYVTKLRGLLAARLAPNTVNKILCAVRGVAREAMRLGLLPADAYTLITDVEGLRGSRLPAGRHVEGPELVHLFGACATTAPRDVRDLALLAVLRLAGLRRAELAELDLADLDRGTFTLRVLGKGDHERLGYIAQARPEIEAWLVLRGEAAGPLFCGVLKSGALRVGRRIGESSIAYVIARLATRAAVAHLSPHDLRRTMVGDLFTAGADLAIVQRIAGHADVKTTARYDRRPEQAAAKAAALLSIPRLV